MITERVGEKTLACYSSYDSSRHTGFNLTLSNDGSWSEERPDSFLTNDQIRLIESVIVNLAKSLLSSENSGA